VSSTFARVAAAALVVAALVVGVSVVLGQEETAPTGKTQPDDYGVPRVAPRLEGRVVDTIGVASFNAWRLLGRAGAEADWDRVTGNPAIDLVGWQESKSEVWADLFPRYRARGWETWYWPDVDGPRSVAVSWRAKTFELLDVDSTKVHDGASPSETAAPFPARWVVEVSLRHRASGLLVTVLNTHVNQTIETGHGWEENLNAERARLHYRTLSRMYDEAEGDVVIGTGDYNWDYADDSTYLPTGGISRTVARHAQSSYAALGLDGVPPTQGSRWIDYVWLSDASVRRRDGAGTAQFERHRSLDGFHSDHRPLLARIRLYGG
jgi:endonuclease/exonuclease/phosphatase family metal-dependent hydrolase